jgi:hypothetical protein
MCWIEFIAEFRACFAICYHFCYRISHSHGRPTVEALPIFTAPIDTSARRAARLSVLRRGAPHINAW